jgi:calcium-dependent protein kinase
VAELSVNLSGVLGEWHTMGGCCSKSPVVEDRQQQQQQKQKQKPPVRTEINGKEKEAASNRNANGGKEQPARRAEPAKKQTPERKQSRITAVNLKNNESHSQPLGKRTNFGYEKDFKEKYTLGKLLGHGQFGYTYVAIEKGTGNKVAAKCIEKKQVHESLHRVVLLLVILVFAD